MPITRASGRRSRSRRPVCAPTAPKPWMMTVNSWAGGIFIEANWPRTVRRGRISNSRSSAMTTPPAAAPSSSMRVPRFPRAWTWLGVQTVFDGDGFHVRIIPARRPVPVRTSRDNAGSIAQSPGPSPGGSRRGIGVGQDTGLAAPEGQVRGGVLQCHPAGQVVDIGGRDLRRTRIPPMEGAPMARLSTTR